MQDFNNKKFRNRSTASMYIDNYLEDLDEGSIDELKSVGFAVTPRDENDVFVPTEKKDPKNLENVVKSMNTAYGLDF